MWKPPLPFPLMYVKAQGLSEQRQAYSSAKAPLPLGLCDKKPSAAPDGCKSGAASV